MRRFTVSALYMVAMTSMLWGPGLTLALTSRLPTGNSVMCALVVALAGIWLASKVFDHKFRAWVRRLAGMPEF